MPVWPRRFLACSSSLRSLPRRSGSGSPARSECCRAIARHLCDRHPRFIYGQLGLGATMRHQHRDLAILDFPLAYGQIIPQTIRRHRSDQPSSRRPSSVRCVRRPDLAANGASLCRRGHRPDIACFWFLEARERSTPLLLRKLLEPLARAPPADHSGCLDDLEQQGSRYRDRARRGRRDHVCHRDRHFRRASSSPARCTGARCPPIRPR